jgi:hypothetical protein
LSIARAPRNDLLKWRRREVRTIARPHYSDCQRLERSLAFYEVALKPLNIKFVMPYKGEDGHPDLWGFGDGKRAFFWIKQGKPDPASIHWGFVAENERSMNSTKRQSPLVPGTTFRPAHDWNTIRDTTPPMYSTQADIHSRSSIRANDGTAHRQGAKDGVVRCRGRNRGLCAASVGAGHDLGYFGSRAPIAA